MNRFIISGRKEDYSIFLHCLCGNEIIQFYYYKQDSVLGEILGLKYYGALKDPSQSIYNHFQFDSTSFADLILKLEIFIKDDSREVLKYYIAHQKEDILKIEKDEDGFYLLRRSKSLKDSMEDIYLWDITFREEEAIELLSALRKLQKYIIDNRNPAKTNKISV